MHIGCRSGGHMEGITGCVNCKIDNRLSTCRFQTANTRDHARLTDVLVRKKKTTVHMVQINGYSVHNRKSQNSRYYSLKSDFKQNEYYFRRVPHINRNARLFVPAGVNQHTRSTGLHVKSAKTGNALLADGGGGNPLGGLIEHASDALGHADEILQVDDFGREIAAFALPAVMAQAIEPMAQLMETVYIGRIGPVELAAVGVSISIFNLVSKIFNVPLLSVTTSFVAEDAASAGIQSQVEKNDEGPSTRLLSQGDRAFFETKSADGSQDTLKKRVLPAVSSALLLATVLGVVEATMLALGAGPILKVMGVPVGSPMRVLAAKYLSLRAFGAPANVVSLAVQGVFRGFKDTRTPLYVTVAGNIFNIALGPILIFPFGLGVIGAAVATVASQYFMAFLLLWNLSKQVVLVPPKLSALGFDRFLKSGGLLLGRTMAILLTMTLATSMAARHGAVSMAGHQILMQIWLATSLLSDALALAGQAILATAFAKGDFRRVKDVAFRVLQMGLSFGLLLALVLSISTGPISKLFTKDSAVLGVLAKGILFVSATQPLNALAFIFDGIHYGVSDFGYAAYSTMVVGLLSSVCMLVATSFLGLPGVWLGLTVLMTLRVAAGVLRLGTASGPWQFLRQ